MESQNDVAPWNIPEPKRPVIGSVVGQHWPCGGELTLSYAPKGGIGPGVQCCSRCGSELYWWPAKPGKFTRAGGIK